MQEGGIIFNSNSTKTIRIANCSGFYGDKLSAAREMVEGGPIDVLTGDYLAELTMAILHKKRLKDETTGYVGTFLKQVREVIEPCLDKHIKIVTNAGGLNPQAMAQQIEAIIAELGLTAKVAWIEGDNLMPRLNALAQSGEPLANIESQQPLSECSDAPVTANAYLGAWGIKEALDQGADIVVCPRVTDAAVVIGPAAWKFNWQRDNYDALAGALAAGHIIECGAQATGGNYAFFQEVPSFHNVGYPIAEIEANGNFTVTKHAGTGGLVSVGTVTAQLLYETNAPAYFNPDVIAHFDSLTIEQTGTDRVYVSGCKGSSAPPSHKVCVNLDGGYRCSLELLLTGLDIEEKSNIFIDELFISVGGKAQFDVAEVQLLRTDKDNPNSNDEAQATLRIIVGSKDEKTVGRLFVAKFVELGLASFPGFFGRPAATPSGPFIKHWPALIDSKHIVEQVHINEQVIDVLPTSQLDLPHHSAVFDKPIVKALEAENKAGHTVIEIPFGRLFGTRSGDKGGCANVGVWAKTDKAYQFLYHYLTVEQLKALLPDMQGFEIDRYELPNLKALNFYIHGVLGDGIAASIRTDGQAKSLGEYLRAKVIQVPKQIVDELSRERK